MKREIINTEDGSSTIYVPELNEHYHSIHGAVQESLHVFIHTGLKQLQKDKLHVFEMGFGTGLNCLLTWLNSDKQEINYTSIEKFPVSPDMTEQLNFTEVLNLDVLDSSLFGSMHNAPWDEAVEIANGFTLHKIKGDIQSYEHKGMYDLIYYDAFAPEVQPDLWNINIFNSLYNSLSTGGVLTTYCAKGSVRRALQASGFDVERLPGPPGKREIVRGTKTL